MPTPDKFSFEATATLPPMLSGIIRWKKNIGSPLNDPCSGFNIRVEEFTSEDWRDIGGGRVENLGKWVLITNSAPCSPSPDEGNKHAVSFIIPDVHINFNLGKYRITPQLTGKWDVSPFFRIFGFRQVEPLSYDVVLTKDSHIQKIEFEVIRRSWFR